MSVKYTNFVEVNINHHISSKPSDLRNVAVAIFYDANLVGDNTQDLGRLSKSDTLPTELTNFKNYVDAFFDNGGYKLHSIITKVTPTTQETVNNQTVTVANDSFISIIKGLPMEEIMVGFVKKEAEATVTEEAFRTVAVAYNEETAQEKIYQKIFVSEIMPTADAASGLSAYINGSAKVVDVENYVLKYGAMGIGASILAYYTKMNVYNTDSAEDYCYTKEVYDDEETRGTSPNTFPAYVFTDNELVKRAMLLDINIDINLSNSVRVIGGNDTAGNPLTNQFMLLVMHQTLTVKLYDVLATKPKYNAQGLSSVLNVITAELNKYVNNGFLSTNKYWTDGDLYHDGYLIIADNTLLNLGYKVVILPYESLTPEDIKAHLLPKIYIICADSYSIRKIVVNGELF